MKRKILAVIMVFAVVLGTFAGTATTASADGGSWGVGAQVTATVDTGRKELIFRSTASTTGDPVKMNQITIGNAPWKEYAEDIEHLIVENGIANISCGAGVDLPNLKDITIGKDVSEIDPRAFINSPSVNSFTVVEGNKYFKDGDNKLLLLTADGKTIVHAAVGALTVYVFPEKDTSASGRVKDDIIAIGDYAFYGAAKLERIKLSSKIAAIGEYAFSGCKIKGDPRTMQSECLPFLQISELSALTLLKEALLKKHRLHITSILSAKALLPTAPLSNISPLLRIPLCLLRRTRSLTPLSSAPPLQSISTVHPMNGQSFQNMILLWQNQDIPCVIRRIPNILPTM